MFVVGPKKEEKNLYILIYVGPRSDLYFLEFIYFVLTDCLVI